MSIASNVRRSSPNGHTAHHCSWPHARHACPPTPDEPSPSASGSGGGTPHRPKPLRYLDDPYASARERIAKEREELLQSDLRAVRGRKRKEDGNDVPDITRSSVVLNYDREEVKDE